MPVKQMKGRETWPADETWYLLYTSGTTGMPKAVIQTYGMAMANYVNISQAMGLRGDDTTLNYLPLFHTGGINLTTLPALIMGAHTLITPGFDLERTVESAGIGPSGHIFRRPGHLPGDQSAPTVRPTGSFKSTLLGVWRCTDARQSVA